MEQIKGTFKSYPDQFGRTILDEIKGYAKRNAYPQDGCEFKRESTKPEFAILKDALQQEVMRSCQLSAEVINRVNDLLPMNEKDNGNEVDVKSNGVIGALWNEVHQLRRANDTLERATNHLTLIIGV